MFHPRKDRELHWKLEGAHGIDHFFGPLHRHHRVGVAMPNMHWQAGQAGDGCGLTAAANRHHGAKPSGVAHGEIPASKAPHR